jgi:hypothetical protein
LTNGGNTGTEKGKKEMRERAQTGRKILYEKLIIPLSPLLSGTMRIKRCDRSRTSARRSRLTISAWFSRFCSSATLYSSSVSWPRSAPSTAMTKDKKKKEEEKTNNLTSQDAFLADYNVKKIMNRKKIFNG